MKTTAALLCLLLQRLYTGDILRQGEICQIGNAWESKDVAEIHLGDEDVIFNGLKAQQSSKITTKATLTDSDGLKDTLGMSGKARMLPRCNVVIFSCIFSVRMIVVMIAMTLMILTLVRGRRREANYEEIRPRGFAGSL